MAQLFAGLDTLSFLLGFITAVAVSWMYRRISPLFRESMNRSREDAATRREYARRGVEYLYRNDFIRYIQGIHLAAPLFSLDEILVRPHILAPPPVIDPGDEILPTDSLSQVIPYLPGIPEFASAFSAERLTLPQALSRGANLALVGAPGGGKTTALAHLGTLIASLSPDAGELADLVPFYLHGADILHAPEDGADPTAVIADTVWNAGYLSRRTSGRFYRLLATAFAEDRVILLVDGLDELAPTGIERARAFLERLLKQHPRIRIVAAVAGEFYDGITSLGLVPVVLAAWTRGEREAFTQRWAERWQGAIDSRIWDRAKSAVEPGMLLNWLGEDVTAQTPLELTLRTWAVFAGDAAGSRNRDMLDAYVRRMTVGVTQAATALQRIGLQMAISRRPIPPSRAAFLWSRGQTEETPADEPDDPEQAAEETDAARVGRGAYQGLVASGVLVQGAGDTVRFVNPLFAAYFAGCGLAAAGGAAAVAAQPDWWLRQWSLHYLAAEIDIEPILRSLEGPDPLAFDLLSAAKWLRDIKPKSDGQVLLMRKLVAVFQDAAQPSAVRQAAIAALALSNETAPVTMSAKWITAQDPLVRSMCALVLGYSRDEKYVPDLVESLSDSDLRVRTASVYALVRIGGQQAIESVATMLLNGDEETQRAAAEALAADPGEGPALLEEAVQMDDLLVRRAAVFGLGRLGTRSAQKIIRKLQLEDDQWIVRNAADQELQKLDTGAQSVPGPYEPLHQLRWLIEFAAELGEGMAPGSMSEDMLHRALLRGNHEQVRAALERYKIAGKREIRAAVEGIARGSDPELQTAAIQALWHLRAQGITAG